jgi:hypothetical protein
MTVYASRTLFPSPKPRRTAFDDDDSILPAWVLAAALMGFFGLITLASIEPFRYDGIARHLVVAALFTLYILGWKEVFRRYLG